MEKTCKNACDMILIIRKHHTNPNWDTFYQKKKKSLSVFLANVKVMIEKEILTDCSRFKEIKDIWQIKCTFLDWILDQKIMFSSFAWRNISGSAGKIGSRSGDWGDRTELHAFPDLGHCIKDDVRKSERWVAQRLAEIAGNSDMSFSFQGQHP